jgi:hypothetical protein
MAARLTAIVCSVVVLGGCAGRSSSSPPSTTDARDSDATLVLCQPVDEDRGACRRPLDTTLCSGTWEDRAPPMCGLRVYEGPGAGYLLQYVSFSDVPPVGGPTWMCIYDAASHQLVGAWALDHYSRWCCGSSLDLFQGVATNDIASVAVSMATHPPCPDAGTAD